ncbi:hypothetical protein [Flavobacterium kingsejongi]|uniref:Thioredoxin domain-containing protein n=1 Tax=Flavobacterium kingsejongi TaxID=1678728 RepID=A0A2S1LJ59_9FLAO|nr:hypothetical protein [Flavobacterium kingsejongi]AWG23804.1 hypothetical protein FK004_00450 [Flavobacterium kingsejongi]
MKRKNYTTGILLATVATFMGMQSAAAQSLPVEGTTFIASSGKEKFKLRFLKDGQYEFVAAYGKYVKAKDTISFALFGENQRSTFEVKTKESPRTNGKIQVTMNSYGGFYYSKDKIFIGTLGKGALSEKFKSLSEYMPTPSDSDSDESLAAPVVFEIDATESLVLVREDDYDGKATLFKYAIPATVSEVAIDFNAYTSKPVTVKFYYDKETSSYRVGEGKDKLTMTLVPESESGTATEANSNAGQLPVSEEKVIANWTYPGKPVQDYDAYTVATDATVSGDAAEEKLVELPMAKNYAAALKQAKKSGKLLVVYADSKNPDAQKDFDAFIKEIRSNLTYSSYGDAERLKEINKFDYYLATAKDKKTIEAFKVKSFPALLIVNDKGELITQATGDAVLDVRYKLTSTNDYYKQITAHHQINALAVKLKSGKYSTQELQSFFKAVTDSDPYDGPYVQVTYNDLGEKVASEQDFKLTKDELAVLFQKLVQTHQSDTKPDFTYVAILKNELDGNGYAKVIFGEDEVQSDQSGFAVAEYLLKFLPQIEENEKSGKQETTGVYRNVQDVFQRILYSMSDYEKATEYQERALTLVNQYFAKTSNKNSFAVAYFSALNTYAENSETQEHYLNAFEGFVTSNFDDKTRVINAIDAIYTVDKEHGGNGYIDWSSYKNQFATMMNNAAWFVVSHPELDSYVKKAQNWSELSLIISKDNPYYLDTLAQLLYKGGNTTEAIKTQQKAVQVSESYNSGPYNEDRYVDEQTLSEIKQVLTQMKAGTYK